MAVRLITPPAVEPITLAEAKAHLRVDHDDEDALIAGLIAAARVSCEQWTARAFVTQTWELVLDEFPVNEIFIPKPPLQSVDSIVYDDPAGLVQVLAASEYEVDTASQPGWVVPSTAGWPAVFEGINAVRIRYVAGYPPGTNSPVDLAENVPQSLKAAILLHAAQLYQNREDVVVGVSVAPLPVGGVDNLLRQFRVALGMA